MLTPRPLSPLVAHEVAWPNLLGDGSREVQTGLKGNNMLEEELSELRLTEKQPKLRLAPANSGAVVTLGDARFTVLADGLVRMEHSPSGAFRDAATQVVTNRDFPVPDFTVREVNGVTEIRTPNLRVRYAGGPFTSSSLNVSMRVASQGNHVTTWYYEEPSGQALPTMGNLGGTVRTLDEVDGAVPLEPGLISAVGFSVLNDSDSLAMTDDGWVTPFGEDETDLYFFGFGTNHQETLRAFFHLTGPSPLLPRKVFGNWWSRYHKYSAEEYLNLMDRFAGDRLPFSVAVIDMDWHLVDIDKNLGTGWTGYTWNKELFPDPEAFLRNLSDRGMLTTLNVHPADGVRRHEDAYEQVARALNVDPESGDEVAFDIANRTFADAYFKYLHHPHEEAGVDFWWVDWQSGENSSIEGLDPLWMLNYLHYEDSAREGRRPLTFSRYAGIGSHRYPIGFSGDALITWESLAFQPYFTAAAANVGYYWWSNDIGGHMFGYKDNELQTRWVQFGVFSPIMRLHSTVGPFSSKEPREYGPEAERIQGEFLRLRHRLIPYLYSAMWEANKCGVAPVRPMYHDYPEAVHGVEGQYMFGPSMLVAPIVTPREPKTGLGSVNVWLPPGEWVDFFTGLRYEGDRTIPMHRTLEEIPVLVKAGAAVPLAGEDLGPVTDHPTDLEFLLFPGPDFEGKIVEDDGALNPEVTTISYSSRWEHASARLELRGDFPAGSEQADEHTRNISLRLTGIISCASVKVDGVEWGVELEKTALGLRIKLGDIDVSETANVQVDGLVADEGRARELVFDLLCKAQVGTFAKEKAWEAYLQAESGGDPRRAIPAWEALDLPRALKSALVEVVTAS